MYDNNSPGRKAMGLVRSRMAGMKECMNVFLSVLPLNLGRIINGSSLSYDQVNT